jgi:NAD(P) transhydrogenase
VIGAGPAGVSGAMAAALMGARTVLVERDAELGGAGINTGTIPSKTLRETALALSGLRARRLHGVDLSLRRETTVADFTRHRDNVVHGRTRARRGAARAVRRRAAYRRGALRRCEYGRGRGSPTGCRVFARRTCWSPPARRRSGRPNSPSGIPRVHDSDEILRIECLPRVLAVIGAGVIGSEYASTFAALGTQVHLIDGRPGCCRSSTARSRARWRCDGGLGHRDAPRRAGCQLRARTGRRHRGAAGIGRRTGLRRRAGVFRPARATPRRSAWSAPALPPASAG